MSIIRKNKTSVGSSLPRNPRDKDLAINSVTGEVKVYNKSSDSWSLVGDGTGAAIPEPVGTNSGDFLQYDGEGDILKWSAVTMPTFLNYQIVEISGTNVDFAGVTNTLNVEQTLNTAVPETTGIYNGKHFIITLLSGEKCDTAIFSGLIANTNRFLGAEFRITVKDNAGQGAFSGPATGFTIFGESAAISGGNTINFKYHNDALYKW